MTVPLEKLLSDLKPARRAKVEARAQVLISEQMSLSDLRRALKKTQASMAQRLKIRQDGISKIESRADMLISTLRQYVGGLGGELRLVAAFRDRQPIEISGISEIDDLGRRGKRRASRSK
jgi:hypothetical protein